MGLVHGPVVRRTVSHLSTSQSDWMALQIGSTFRGTGTSEAGDFATIHAEMHGPSADGAVWPVRGECGLVPLVNCFPNSRHKNLSLCPFPCEPFHSDKTSGLRFGHLRFGGIITELQRKSFGSFIFLKQTDCL
jgi:hypothetical protein